MESQEKRYDVVVEDDFVVVRAGVGCILSTDTIIGMLRDLYALDAYRADKRCGLWDLRGCKIAMHFDDMARVRSFIEAHYDPSWTHQFTALVVDQDVQYGMARMYDIMTERIPTELEVFRDIDAARGWLTQRDRETGAHQDGRHASDS